MFAKRFRRFDPTEIICNLFDLSMHIVLEFENSDQVQAAIDEVLSCSNAFHTKGPHGYDILLGDECSSKHQYFGCDFHILCGGSLFSDCHAVFD